MYKLNELIDSCDRAFALIDGEWVYARPIQYFSVQRIKDAWKVLTYKADAFVWPKNQ